MCAGVRCSYCVLLREAGRGREKERIFVVAKNRLLSKALFLI
jgi:hypothetical protein